ncbi:nucleotidyl transferase AbiEii/AbiGii toxin family protein [Micromonospora sp. NBC_00389]|uniref:nucleotidyl transferase AbiEii/AbiGii toxin family protein n=1 Tax=Micromonospora sp. NBC_00389 TaxID=2903586 RepID=UPI002E1AD7E7
MTAPVDIAQRAVLDHLLGLVAESHCADTLVLCGSLTMPAWLGEQARPPGDVDWVVRPLAFVPRDDRDPYPYLPRLDPVQHWPEAAHGAARNEIWTYEEFETGGQHPRLPPEGLSWLSAVEEPNRPHDELLEVVARKPYADNTIRLDAEAADRDAMWGYTEYGNSYEGAGVRLHVPWHAPDGSTGSVQLDFAYDEYLPEPPVLTAVPRRDGRPPAALWTASRELSLVWKLRWLCTDQAERGVSAGKDLYDAVLLAELDGIRISRRLRRLVLGTALLSSDAVRSWAIDGSGPLGADAEPWLVRLARAVQVLYEA